MFGGYLRIDLIGKRQTQEGDNLYYSVIRYVSCFGLPISALEKRNILKRTLLKFALQKYPSLSTQIQQPEAPISKTSSSLTQSLLSNSQNKIQTMYENENKSEEKKEISDDLLKELIRCLDSQGVNYLQMEVERQNVLNKITMLLQTAKFREAGNLVAHHLVVVLI